MTQRRHLLVSMHCFAVVKKSLKLAESMHHKKPRKTFSFMIS